MPGQDGRRGDADLRRELKAEIEASADGFLPSMATLRARLGVGMGPLARALAALAREGKLEIRPRRRIRIPGKVPADPATLLAAEIRDGIGDGRFPPGSPLPKLSYWTLERGVSNQSVLKAYGQLAAQGLIHKRGRRYWVGPDPGSRPARAGGQAPAIFLLLDKRLAWQNLFAPRTEAFCRAFSQEADNHGVKLITVFSRSESLPVGRFLVGREAILREARSLGKRFAGTLIPLSLAQLPDLPAWARALGALGKPTVWFDRIGEGPAFPPGLRPPPGFLPCRYDEERVVKAALDYLWDQGHRHILYPHGDADWEVRRARIAQRLGQAYPVTLRILPLRLSRPDWHAALDGLEGQVRLFRRLGSENIRRELRLFLEDCPDYARRLRDFPRAREYPQLLEHLRAGRTWRGGWLGLFPILLFSRHYLDMLGRREYTAMLAPNDARAEMFYRLLDVFAIPVPEGISLLSFDNSREIHPLPVSSVDMGFGRLGFQAFHALLGYLPVTGGGKGGMVAQPRVVERGSVGPPPSRPRRSPWLGDG